MQLLGRKVSDGFLFFPTVCALGLLAFFILELSEEIRSSYIFISCYLVFGLIGLSFYWKFQSENEPFEDIVLKISNLKIYNRLLDTLVFICISGGVISLEFGSKGAVRPTSFYAFTAAAIAILGIKSILIPNNNTRNHVWFIFQILIIGGLIRLSRVYLNPYPYVSDTQFHWHIIQLTLENQQFLGLGPYKFYPIFHLFNSVFYLLTFGKISSPWAFPFINSIIIVFTLILFYIIGRQIHNARVGLLVLVLSVTSNYYFLGIGYKTNFIGVTFVLIGLILLFDIITCKYKNIQIWLLFWIITLVILLVHPISYIAYIIMLMGALISTELINYTRQTSIFFGSRVPLLSTSILFLSYIMFIHSTFFDKIINITIGIEQSVGTRLGLTINVVDLPIYSGFATELVLNSLGITLLIIFIVPGLLYSIKDLNTVKNSISIGIMILYIFVIVIMFSRGADLQITRMLLYISPFLGIMGSLGMVYILSQFHLKNVLTFIFIFIFILSMFSMTSYLGGSNYNGILTNDVSSFHHTIKPSTLAAHSFLIHIKPGSSITGDKFTSLYISSNDPIRGMNTLRNHSNVTLYFRRDWNNSQFYIINKPVLESLNYATGPGYNQLEHRLEESHSKVYSNTDLGIYYK